VSAPTLVLLAAGLGSRYGGLKQLDPLGPGGATLMDYAVHDGWRAGFGTIVFVIRPEMEAAFERQLGARYRARLPVATALQRLEDLPGPFQVPPGRTRPWGTTQAVLATRAAVPGQFAVLNADDFYGREAITAAARFLEGQSAASTTHAVVGYPLEQTASPSGGVNRALLGVASDGTLEGVSEIRGLTAIEPGWFEGERGGLRRRVLATSPVSMNLWAFSAGIFPVLERDFRRFLEAAPAADGECYIPDSVARGIADGKARVTVLPTSSRWCGVTYPGDRDWVQRELQALVARGEYPEMLWP
jgi:hypothetical protein